MEIKINGGKLFLDGKEIPLKNKYSNLEGGAEPCYASGVVISAGQMYVSGNPIHEFSREEFEALKEGAE